MSLYWQPKKTKFKRLQKGTIAKCTYRLSNTHFQHGAFGLRVLKSGRLTAKQLEIARRKLTFKKKRKKTGKAKALGLKQKKPTRIKAEKPKIWSRSLPDIPVTSKPIGIRMGKGKGNVNYWVSRLLAGKVIFHVSYMPRRNAFHALSAVAKVLPIPTQFVTKKRVSKKKVTTRRYAENLFN